MKGCVIVWFILIVNMKTTCPEYPAPALAPRIKMLCAAHVLAFWGTFVLATISVVWWGRGRCAPLEASVVSVYTTQPTTAGTGGLDVYHQIASNIAERITSPIYRFLGIVNNKTEDQPSTKRPWEKIELLEEPDEVTKSADPISNDIDDRDVEELSVEGLRRSDKKPEKITLFSNYLPVNQNLEKNDTINEIDKDSDIEPFGFDEVAPQAKDDGPFVYILELLGSLFQLAWGAFESLFKPSPKPGSS